ncbi:MAG: NADP-dependent oxidoreductase [Blastocatellia bacterium]|nr:NADP-dependent oxidoreductase [Blastocatellia bacterium]
MTTKTNRQWRLAARPVGLIKDSDFTWTEEPVREVQDGEILVQNKYISLDPTNRVWVTDVPSYLPPVGIGEVMRGGAIGEVIESRNPAFTVGSHVQGLLGWQDYYVGNGQGLQALPNMPGVPLTAFMGLFSHIGLTAYFGLLDITNPKEGETLVVTGAAGAVGSLVGQIGKIKGMRVVGVAGSDEKCKWIVDDLGFDAAVNYKTENVREALKKHCPNGIDVDFENVGGKIFDDILSLMNLHGRISLCGAISGYNSTEPVPGPYNFFSIISKRLRVEGFIVMDYYNRAHEAMNELGQWLMQGKIKYRIDEADGLDKAPQALNKLFTGENVGKLVVKV